MSAYRAVRRAGHWRSRRSGNHCDRIVEFTLGGQQRPRMHADAPWFDGGLGGRGALVDVAS